MLVELEKMQEEFKRIKALGWVKEKRKGLGSCGYTFEQIIKKEEDNFPVPDYHGIEIKVMNTHAKTNLHLFNLIPDGDYLFPIKRLLDAIGCPCKDNRVNKKLFRTFNTMEYTPLVFGKKGKIVVNHEDKKISLLVINNKNENININVSWSFDYLKERLLLKLKYLALIRASSRIISGEGYYYYNRINYYKLKDFDTFIRLIELGLVEITFKVGIHSDDKKKDKIYDHGTDFSIKVENLKYLYDEIFLV